MYKLILFLILFASILAPIGCGSNFDSEKTKTKNMEFLNHSLLWKNLTSSSSRQAIAWAISYLSQNKPVTANEKQILFDPSDTSENVRPENTINELMNESIEYQDWLKGQKIEVIVKLIEDYRSFLYTRSPYYPD